MKKYDVAIIGAGPGGAAAAKVAVGLGAKTVIIEKEQVGGVCLNWGCIPTKAILASTTLCRRIKQSLECNILGDDVKALLPNIMKRKDDIVTTLRDGSEAGLKRKGIDLIYGEARFDEDHVLSVKTHNGTEQVTAPKIIIAVGSEPRELPFLPFDGIRVCSSKDLLALQEVPHSLVIVGGGAIGCEFADMFNTLGAQITIIEMEKNLLPTEDEELGKRLALAFKKRGMTILTDDPIVEANIEDAGVHMITKTGKVIKSEKILVAIGRKRLIDTLNIENTKITTTKDAINVNNFLETAFSGVFAIGDVIKSPLLAHVAMYEGRIAAYNAVCGNKRTVDYTIVPNCVFTTPEIASVGLTRAAAQKEGIAAKTTKELFSANGKAYCIGEPEGFVKLVYDEASGIILGGQIMGPEASDLIADISLAVKNEMTLEDLAYTIHVHPTLAEAVQDAALNGLK